MDGMKLFAIYLAVMNVLGVAVMWSDKRRARLHRWRIPEKVLFGVSLLGGSAGTWAGSICSATKDEALVFCGRNAAHSGLPGGTCNLSGALICFITNCYRRYVFSD